MYLRFRLGDFNLPTKHVSGDTPKKHFPKMTFHSHASEPNTDSNTSTLFST